MADLKISALTASTTPLAGTEVLPIVQSSTTKKVSVANLTAGRAVSMQSITANNTGLATPVGNFESGDQAGARVAVINSGAGGQTYHLVTGNPGVSNSGFALYDSTNSATRLYVGSSTGDLTLNTGNLVIGTSGKGIDFSANTNAAGMTSEVLTWYEEGTWTPTIAGQITAGTGTYTNQVAYYTRIGRVVYVSLNLAWSAHTGTGDMQVNGLPFTVNSTVVSQMSIGTYDLALTALNMPLARAQKSGTFIKLLQSPVGGGAWNGVPMDTSVTVLEITGFYTV